MRRRRAVWRTLLIAPVLAMLLSGCWNSISIADRAPVVGLAVSPAGGSLYDWTFLIPNPSITESSLANLQVKDMYYPIRVEAASFPEALTRAQMNLARRLLLDQLEVVAWSPTMSIGAVHTLIAALNENGAVNKTYWAVVTPKPGSLLNMTGESVSEPVPGFFLADLFDCRTCQPMALGVRGWQAWTYAVTPGMSLTIPYADSQGVVQQAAVYARTGRPHVLSPAATLGYAYLTDHVMAEAIPVTLPAGRAVLTTTSLTRRTHVSERDGHLAVAETLLVSARLLQLPPDLAFTRQVQSSITDRVAARIAALTLHAVHVAARDHTDPFGFSRRLYWQRATWPTATHGAARIPLGPVTVTVHVRLTNEGVMS